MAQSTASLAPPRTQDGEEQLPASPALEERRLAQRVERALHVRGYRALRAVTVTVRGPLVILQGRVPSYYMKQMAQEAALEVPGVRKLRNDVQVIRVPGGSKRANEK